MEALCTDAGQGAQKGQFPTHTQSTPHHTTSHQTPDTVEKGLTHALDRARLCIPLVELEPLSIVGAPPDAKPVLSP